MRRSGADTFGAVFIGEGEYLLNPATSAERRHLQLVTNTTEVLKDRFTKLVLLFTDRTAAEILAHAPAATGSPDQAATRAYEDYLNRTKNEDLPNLHLRVLADLLNRPTRTDGVFLAFVEGQNYSPVLLAVDPLGISRITTRFSFYGGEEVALFSFNNMNGGLWYSSTFAPQAVAGRGKPIRMLADASHYEIDTTLDGVNVAWHDDGHIHATDRRYSSPSALALPTAAFHERIDGCGRSAGSAHHASRGPRGCRGVKAPRDESGSVDVAVLFREPLVRGTPVKVTLAYEGRDVVVKAAGSNHYSVGARTSWYPNLGSFDDVATYSMTFRFSARNDLIAVGEQVSERTEGGQKIAVWRSQQPIRVAGFNYGDFQKTSRTDPEAGISVDVYVNRGPEFANMAGIPLADAVNTARVGGLYFGATPFSRVSITQQPQLASAQSWPTLVFLSTISFLSPQEQERRICWRSTRVAGFEGVRQHRRLA